MGYPRLKYPAGSTSPTTIDFKRGPIDFICEADARSHSSLAASGFRAANNEAVDLLIKFTMPAVRIGDDYQAWAAFAAWASTGNQFDFWPNTNISNTFHCVSEDLSFAPSHKGVGWYEIQFVWRIVPDALRPLNSGEVMQWYYGLGTVLGAYGLCGAWADSSGNVIKPVWIGKGPKSLTCPAGATQLQLGINDENFSDNSGSFTVSCNGADYTVIGTAQPWLFTGGINAGFPIDKHNGTSPTVISGFSAGDVVEISSSSGMVNYGGGNPSVDANGIPDYDYAANNPGEAFPSFYMK